MARENEEWVEEVRGNRWKGRECRGEIGLGKKGEGKKEEGVWAVWIGPTDAGKERR
jgi:hypothetical protein